jgi:hypothetical protein
MSDQFNVAIAVPLQNPLPVHTEEEAECSLLQCGRFSQKRTTLPNRESYLQDRSLVTVTSDLSLFSYRNVRSILV